jgi:uncharacterized protein YciI
MNKLHYALYLNPPRATFMQDMTDEEKKIMQQHVVYWTGLLNKGTVVVFGPVLDPQGGYGLGVVEAENEQQVKDLIAGDPANGLNKYEFYPMRAVTQKR